MATSGCVLFVPDKAPGGIDIEGWHDPVYRDDLKMTAQVHGLNYLKQCRGGAFPIPNESSVTNSELAPAKSFRRGRRKQHARHVRSRTYLHGPV